MSFVFFLLSVGLLALCGFLCATLVLGKTLPPLRIALALPLGSLLNALHVLALTVLHIPLSPLPLFASTLFLALLLLEAVRCRPPAMIAIPSVRAPAFAKRERSAITAVASAFLCVAFAYAAFHALVLPSAQWDSLSNWTMRSEVSFYDHAIAFDRDESRGVAKPQYPFLFHALQIAANQGQREWNDHAANGILFLLSLSSFAALFLILKMLRGTATALLGISLITGIPLLAFHLAQGYADLPLAQFLLLALVATVAALETSDGRWLFLASVLVVAGAWTKLEGLFAGVLPYLLLLGIFWKQRAFSATILLRNAALAILPSILFPLFALAHGLLLTAHTSDAALAWSTEGFSRILPALFASGSLGAGFFALLAATLILVLPGNENRMTLDPKLRMTLLWGGMVFLEYLVLYLFTSNVQFLLNEQSFYRQMLVPVTLLGLSLIVSLSRPVKE